MSNPLGPGQPGSWTRRRFLIDLTFAGGALVAAAWLAYGNQPTTDSTVAKATASPTPPKPVRDRQPSIEACPANSQHNAPGGAPMRLPQQQIRTQSCGPDPRKTKPAVKVSPSQKSI